MYRNILRECVNEAKKSSCDRSRCGAIIIDLDDNIIGRGYNSPAANEAHRCEKNKSDYNIKVTDKTCCIHAEQRAILEAVKNKKILGSTLYFIRLDNEGKPKPSTKPYCTICSKLALEVGIEYFALFHDLLKPRLYKTQEYNNISFEYE